MSGRNTVLAAKSSPESFVQPFRQLHGYQGGSSWAQAGFCSGLACTCACALPPFRLRIRSTAKATKQASANPPTTPPTIAPVFVCCSGELREDGLADGGADVAKEADSSVAVDEVESGGIVDIADVTCRDMVDEVR